MGKNNSSKSKMVTHINQGHSKGNVFGKERTDAGHPKVKEGCYANSEHPQRQEKM